jgi:hypothetical protein
MASVSTFGDNIFSVTVSCIKKNELFQLVLPDPCLRICFKPASIRIHHFDPNFFGTRFGPDTKLCVYFFTLETLIVDKQLFIENCPVVESYFDIAANLTLNAEMQRCPVPTIDLTVNDQNSIYFEIDVSSEEDYFDAFLVSFTALYHEGEALAA